jgi:ryanodine receptor 2
MKTYTPTPRDLSHLTLPDELIDLREMLAEHVHDVWAQARIAQGWRYGPMRDDVKLEHPNLLPYDQLSEADKEYDRVTADASLKLIMAHGWQVLPPTSND